MRIMKKSIINNYEFEYNDENYIRELKKYINISNRKKELSMYSLGIFIILISLLIPIKNINNILLIVEGLLILDVIIFVFNFASYLSYRSVIKLMEKYVICKENDN